MNDLCDYLLFGRGTSDPLLLSLLRVSPPHVMNYRMENPLPSHRNLNSILVLLQSIRWYQKSKYQLLKRKWSDASVFTLCCVRIEHQISVWRVFRNKIPFSQNQITFLNHRWTRLNIFFRKSIIQKNLMPNSIAKNVKVWRASGISTVLISNLSLLSSTTRISNLFLLIVAHEV